MRIPPLKVLVEVTLFLACASVLADDSDRAARIRQALQPPDPAVATREKVKFLRGEFDPVSLVREAYLTYLYREPRNGEERGWVDRIEAIRARESSLRNSQRILDVLGDIRNSPEARICRAFWEHLGRLPRQQDIEYWEQRIRDLSASGDAEKVFDTMSAEIMGSPERALVLDLAAAKGFGTDIWRLHRSEDRAHLAGLAHGRSPAVYLKLIRECAEEWKRQWRQGAGDAGSACRWPPPPAGNARHVVKRDDGDRH